MKSALLIIAAVIIILLLPASIDAINDFRTDTYTESHSVTTGAESSQTFVLAQDLFNDATSYISSISSNYTSDAPLPGTYTAATNTLQVTGLSGNYTRLITLSYGIDGLSDYPGSGIAARMWPTMIILGVFGLIAGAVFLGMRRGGE